MTPLEIEPTTFWLVTQCLNQLRHCVPRVITVETIVKFLNQCIMEINLTRIKILKIYDYHGNLNNTNVATDDVRFT
jgi:hypothetical protein